VINLKATIKNLLKSYANSSTYNAAYNLSRFLKKIAIFFSSLTFTDSKKTIHFIHIGKTGGSSVRHALSDISCSKHYKFFFHNHDVRLEEIPRGRKVFFFLREPSSRFVSGFYSRKRMGQPKYYQPWTVGETEAFSKFSSPNDLAESLSSQDNFLRDSAVRAMSEILHVKDSYSYWFKDHNYFLSRLSDIVFIGFQETLEADFSRLKLKLDLSAEVVLPANEEKSHKTPSDLDKKLSCSAMENLIRWYADDYTFLKFIQEVAFDK
jgi:hypothetical protein